MTPELDGEVVRAALSSTGLGVFELDARTLNLRLDAECAGLLGLDTHELPLSSFLARVQLDDRARLHERLSTIAAAGGAESDVHEELDWLPPRGSVAHRLELRGRHMRDPGGRTIRFAGTIRDVTDQRGVDEERDQQIEELKRTVLFSEMFVGILAHDLRNPLGGIMVAAQLVGRRAKEAGVEALLGRIITSGERIGRMVEQLLDFSCARVGSGIPLHLVDADLMTIAKDVLAELQVANPGCALSLEGMGVTAGRWDADRLAQVLSNLVGNAVQHGAVDRGVRVYVDGTSADDVVVRVHNHGLVPAELMPVLFNPFRATQHKRDGARGLGLGLYVTRQITVAHGGDVEVASAEPEGTTFRVTLPRAPSVRMSRAPDGPDEMLALERIANPARATTVTAQLFGVVSLHERSPRAYWQIFERYGALLDLLVQRRVYKETPAEAADFSAELRAIADRLGALNAGAREVAELHARAIRLRTRGVPIVKSQALIAEGRLMSFELMGHLLSFYRRRAGSTGGGVTTE